MRYLKTYKLFEELPWVDGVYKHEEGSTQKRVADKIKEVEEITQTIKDILLPISDMGYDISVRDNAYDSGPIYKSPTEFIIRIVLYTDNPLEINEEVKDEFDRLNDYLESLGLTLYIKGVTIFDAEVNLKYNEFISNYLSNSLSIKDFRNLLFIAKI
jgi:hypothetical protein